MFERFTSGARDVVVRAQEHADALGHNYIGTEHLLLGLLDARASEAGELLARAGVTHESVLSLLSASRPLASGRIDPDALAAIGIDLDEVRRRVEASFGPGALERTRAGCRGRHRPVTPRAKKALELALREAVELGSRRIEPAHILLGLVRAGEGVAPAVLRDHGLTLARARDELFLPA